MGGVMAVIFTNNLPIALGQWMESHCDENIKKAGGWSMRKAYPPLCLSLRDITALSHSIFLVVKQLLNIIKENLQIRHTLKNSSLTSLTRHLSHKEEEHKVFSRDSFFPFIS